MLLLSFFPLHILNPFAAPPARTTKHINVPVKCKYAYVCVRAHKEEEEEETAWLPGQVLPRPIMFMLLGWFSVKRISAFQDNYKCFGGELGVFSVKRFSAFQEKYNSVSILSLCV